MTATTDDTATTTASPCPPWCTLGAHTSDDGHTSVDVEIELSHGKPYPSLGEMLADHVAVSTWNDPRHPAAVVSVRHVDHYLPSMTPAEARQVAAELITAAGRAEPGGLRGPAAAPVPGCPSWCTTGPHAPLDCIHGTDYRDVAGAVPPGHFCGWATDPGEDGPCPDDTISATLMTVRSGPAQVYVSHGDDSLPAMTIDGAEQVAHVILGLVREARGSGA